MMCLIKNANAASPTAAPKVRALHISAFDIKPPDPGGCSCVGACDISDIGVSSITPTAVDVFACAEGGAAVYQPCFSPRREESGSSASCAVLDSSRPQPYGNILAMSPSAVEVDLDLVASQGRIQNTKS